MKAKQSKAQYTLEFKQEAIRLVKSGQSIKQVATTLGMPHQTLDNWLRADNSGKLSGAGDRVVTPRANGTCPFTGWEYTPKNGTWHIKKSGSVLCQRSPVKYAWIQHNHSYWPISAMCHVLEVSESGYYHTGHAGLLVIASLMWHCSRTFVLSIRRSKVNMVGRACGEHCKLAASKLVKSVCVKWWSNMASVHEVSASLSWRQIVNTICLLPLTKHGRAILLISKQTTVGSI